MRELKGLGVSPGVVVGEALVLRRHAFEMRFKIPPEGIEGELFRLARARAHAIRQLQEIKARIAERAGSEHAYLFDAQLLMLDDAMLIDRAAALIEQEHVNAEWAVQRASEELTSLLRQAEDPYVRERQGDIEDVVGRLRLNLRGAGDPGERLSGIQGPAILVADDLPPSVAAQIDWQVIVGFSTDTGSWTHHTAILARSLGVPAVVGLHSAARTIVPGQQVLLDGTSGRLCLDPTPEFVDSLRRQEVPPRAVALVAGPTVTADGQRVRLLGNVERAADGETVRAFGGEGIGLFRSEFLLASHRWDELSEAFQTEIYRELLGGMAPLEVTIRTFDLSERPDAAARVSRADSLGHRGLRVSLSGDQDVLLTQYRSLLRAAAGQGNLRILLPFVSGVEEVRAARALLARAADELHASGIDTPTVPLGIMIEVPSAVAVADLLAREVDFMSIGTNDLVQYGLAVDRTDERLAHLYEPLHPGVLRMIRTVARVTRRRGCRTAVCGEMATDPCGLAVLIGLGLREFSMAPSLIPEIAALLRDLRAADARRITQEVLRLSTAAEIRRRVRDWLGTAAPAGTATR
jgi:phosphotransferase system enzyme I (PtsI)